VSSAIFLISQFGFRLVRRRSVHSLSSRLALRYPRGITVHVARPARSILHSSPRIFLLS